MLSLSRIRLTRHACSASSHLARRRRNGSARRAIRGDDNVIFEIKNYANLGAALFTSSQGSACVFSSSVPTYTCHGFHPGLDGRRQERVGNPLCRRVRRSWYVLHRTFTHALHPSGFPARSCPAAGATPPLQRRPLLTSMPRLLYPPPLTPQASTTPLTSPTSATTSALSSRPRSSPRAPRCSTSKGS